MRILLIEDDFSQAERIQRALLEGFPDVEVRHITTESEFRSQLTEITQNAPDLAIIDVMVRWADPGPQIPEAPPEVQKESYFRAGVRCAKLLADCRTKVPIVFYTILEKNNSELDGEFFPNQVIHLRKGSDPGLNDLVQLIHTMLRAPRP